LLDGRPGYIILRQRHSGNGKSRREATAAASAAGGHPQSDPQRATLPARDLPACGDELEVKQMGKVSFTCGRRQAFRWLAGVVAGLLAGCSSGPSEAERYESALRRSLGRGDELLDQVLDYLDSFPPGSPPDLGEVNRWLGRRPEGAIAEGIRAYRSVRDVSPPTGLGSFHRRLVEIAEARAEALGHVGRGALPAGRGPFGVRGIRGGPGPAGPGAGQF
jgi:hypothetical protein